MSAKNSLACAASYWRPVLLPDKDVLLGRVKGIHIKNVVILLANSEEICKFALETFKNVKEYAELHHL